MSRQSLLREGLTSNMGSSATVSQREQETQRRPNTAQDDDITSNRRPLHSFQRKNNNNHTNNSLKHASHQHKSRQTNNKPDRSEYFGDDLGPKQEGMTRMVYENFNGLAPWHPENEKITLAKRYLRKIKADCYTGVECRAQWDMIKPKHQLTEIFSTGVPIRTSTSYNKHEAVIRNQEGGTALMMFGQMAREVKTTGSDILGRLI